MVDFFEGAFLFENNHVLYGERSCRENTDADVQKGRGRSVKCRNSNRLEANP